MLTRVISGAVAVVLFIAIVYFLPAWCFSIAVSAICAVSAYELVRRSGIVKSCALLVLSCTFAAAAPFFVLYLSEYLIALMFFAFASMFLVWLISQESASLRDVLVSFVGGAILPVFFSHILIIRQAAHGEFWILFPFVAAWMTDTGAYFVGVLFGKHKLCEKISPKKTIEGAIGGVAVCVASLLAFGAIMHANFGTEINYIALGISALVLSVLAQMGDLSFSLIKREYNIKDYGNVMPGHGGVLDRFDSAMFTIPASYILLRLIGGIL